MSYTKGELALSALEELGIAEYEFDISVEQKKAVIKRLDSMMAEWYGKGIKISFPISKVEDSSVDDETGIPDWAWEAVITNLAIRIAPSYGKTVSMETRIAAKNSYNVLCKNFVEPKEMQLPSIPKGAGYKNTDSPFTPPPEDTFVEPVDEDIDFSGGYSES